MSEYKLSHLKELESESIHIIREVAAEFENPVMLYSIGKDSSVMVRLAEKAFAPGKVPFPLMHIDSKWKFKEMIEFRDKYAQEHNWNLIVEYNKEAYEAGVGPFTHGSKVHTDLMKTQALLHALDKYKFDAAFGGARRDEEKSRAKERPIVNIDGNLIMVDDDRMPEAYRKQAQMMKVRFRTLGCYPLTGAIESEADTIEKIVEEMMTTTKSERTTRVIDFDQEASMEQKKREGYF